MPAYNVCKYIHDAISSIRKQTVENWELVVVDDGSTDNTTEIVSSMMKDDPRIRLITMESPSGSAYQPRKKGIEDATTDWVAPLDADDWIAPDYLERLLEKQRETEVDAVYPTMYKSDGKDSKRVTPLKDELYKASHPGKNCVSLTLDGWQINCNGGLIKKDCYLRAFPKMEDKWLETIFSDELLTRVLLCEYESVAFSDAKYFYRTNPESVTQKKSLRQFHFLKRNSSLLKVISQKFGESSEEYRLAQRQNFHGVFEGLRMLNKRNGFSKEERRTAKKIIQDSAKDVDLSKLKGFVSPRYYSLFVLGLPIASRLLRVIDLIRGSKCN